MAPFWTPCSCWDAEEATRVGAEDEIRSISFEPQRDLPAAAVARTCALRCWYMEVPGAEEARALPAPLFAGAGGVGGGFGGGFCCWVAATMDAPMLGPIETRSARVQPPTPPSARKPWLAASTSGGIGAGAVLAAGGGGATAPSSCWLAEEATRVGVEEAMCSISFGPQRDLPAAAAARTCALRCPYRDDAGAVEARALPPSLPAGAGGVGGGFGGCWAAATMAAPMLGPIDTLSARVQPPTPPSARRP